LSFLHNTLRNEKSDPIANKVLLLPSVFFDWPFSRQVDYHIDHNLPTLISWIRGWVEAESNDGFPTRILFTHFEDFKRDKSAFIRKILDFYGIEVDGFDYDYIKRRPKLRETQQNKKRNEKLFRKGLTDEWREVFSAEQTQRANSLLPLDLCSRFGWETTRKAEGRDLPRPEVRRGWREPYSPTRAAECAVSDGFKEERH